MIDWLTFDEMVSSMGPTRRDRLVDYARDSFERYYAPDQPSYSTVLIDGEEVDMLVMGADSSEQKKFRVMPSDNHKVTYGDIVEWANSHWIVIQADLDDTVSRRGYMQYCNHLFRFQARDGRIIERWGVLDPGVYSTTIKNTLAMPELNTQYKVYLPYDEDTKYLYIDQRFAGGSMYDPDGNEVLVVYKFTKYDPLTQNQGDGRLLVMHCAADAYDPKRDNLELGICDYIDPAFAPTPSTLSIEPVSSANPVVGGRAVVYRCVIDEGELPTDLTWTLDGADMTGVSIEPDGSSCKVRAARDAIMGNLLVLKATSVERGIEATRIVEVVSLYE